MQGHPSTTRRRFVSGLAALPLAAGTASAQAPASLPVREALAAAEAGRLTLVDIRTPDEWADTGVPRGARPLDVTGSAFEVRLAGLRLDHPGRPIALIDRSGAQSSATVRKLAGRGWRDLVAVRDGMLGPAGWLAEKLPVTAYP
jgi:rhodanese-related sulfurtransferase